MLLLHSLRNYLILLCLPVNSLECSRMRSSLQLSRSQDWTTMILVLIDQSLTWLWYLNLLSDWYLKMSNLLPPLQSGFRQRHSTETAELSVLLNILEAVDHGGVCVLALLNLSAAYNLIDHNTLTRHLIKTCGINGEALRWFQSYLIGRKQSNRRGSCCPPG